MPRSTKLRPAGGARPTAASAWSEFEHQPPPDPVRKLNEEETLLVAILHRGLIDYATVLGVRNGTVRPTKELPEMLDAERWVKSRAGHPFSFEFCCWQGLGQDPELVRETVTKHWQRLLTKDAAVIFATYTPPKDMENAGL